MRRISHDLGGLAQRFNRLSEQLTEEIQNTAEIWRDQRGQAFLAARLSPFKPSMGQLVASIDETRELFDQMAKKLSDPDNR